MPRRTKDPVKLTKADISAIPLPEKGKRVTVWDTEVRGLGVRKTATGVVTFFYTDPKDLRRQRFTIGNHPPMAVEIARAKARELAGQVAGGRDPVAEARAQRKNASTFREWVEVEYLDHCVEHKKDPRHDVRYLLGCVDGAGKVTTKSVAMREWQYLKLHEITAGMVRKLHRNIKKDAATSVAQRMGKAEERLKVAAKANDKNAVAKAQEAIDKVDRIENPGNTTANRWLASVRACFAEAVRRELLTANPAVNVKPYRENPPHHNPLSDEEWARLTKVVEAMPDEEKDRRVLLQVLMGTGARKSEVLRMKWKDLKLDHAPPFWTIPSPKAGKPQSMPLASSVVEALQSLNKVDENQRWVFPSPKAPTVPREDIRRLWAAVCKRAGINHRVHDVRHTFGLNVRKKYGAIAAQRLLRHADLRTTMGVYAPLDDLELVEVVEGMLSDREHEEPASNVVSFTRAK